MNCRDAHRQIDQLGIDPFGQAGEDLRAHVADCADCRRRLERTRRLRDDLLPRADDGAWREAASARVRLALRSTSAPSFPGGARGRGLARRVALAASLFVALLAGAWGAWLATSRRPMGLATPQTRRVEPVSLWTRAGLCARPAWRGDDIALWGDSVYCLVGTPGEERVARLDRTTGRRVWVSNVPVSGYLTAWSGGVCCVSTHRGELELIALDGRDGRRRWRVAAGRLGMALGSTSLSAPAVVDGNRLCWVARGVARLIDAAGGKELWTRGDLPGEGRGGASVWRGKPLIAGAGGLVCLDVGDGSERWRIERAPSGADLAGPARWAVRGRWAVLASGRRVALLDLARREVVWDRPAGGVHHVGLDSRRVYVRGRSVQCLDRRTGDVLWERPAKGCGPITVREGRAYFVDVHRRGALVAVCADSGEISWHVEGLPSCDAYVSAGEATYLKTRDGVLHALASAR